MENESLSKIVSIKYFTPANTEFTEESGFLSLKLPAEEGAEEKTYSRVFLHRMFPFEEPERYLSVLDSDQNELGIIEDLALFEESTREILRRELRRKYYMQEIRAILRVKDRYGFTYWDVETPEGKVSFTLQDTQRSLVKMSAERLMIIDIDGNRYEITALSRLDRVSYKKIELYL